MMTATVPAIVNEADDAFTGFPLRRPASMTHLASPTEESVLDALDALGGEAEAVQLAEEAGFSADGAFLVLLSSLCHWRLLRRDGDVYRPGPLACRFASV